MTISLLVDSLVFPMVDFLSTQERSIMMSKVRVKDTSIERAVRSALHILGYRFRKNVKELPGRPDIVLPKYKAIIFVHGCFWHGHIGCPKSKLPSTRPTFWEEKIKANIFRDKRDIELLLEQGWRTAVVWECSLKNKQSLKETIEALSRWIKSTDYTFETSLV